MDEIVLKLTQEETNQVLQALSEQPFKMVFTLIGNIQEQVASQLKQQSQPEPEGQTSPPPGPANTPPNIAPAATPNTTPPATPAPNETVAGAAEPVSPPTS